MTTTQTLLTLTDNLLTLSGLQNAQTLAYLNAATVTVSLADKDTGTPIAGSTGWPLAMPYVALSDGVYQAILANGLTTVLGQRIVATITANQGGLKRVFVVPVQVENG